MHGQIEAAHRDGAWRRRLREGFLVGEGWLSSVVGEAWNPLAQLGALGFLLFWIVVVSGIYLYIFFDTSVVGAFESVERLTVAQWYAGGVMRSLHRYASDAFVVVLLVHMAREVALDRYRGVRWFAWITGVPILWLALAAGVGGYWLVWDRLAQFIAVVTAEWLDVIPIFGEPIANNFLTRGSLGDRFFTLLVFLHIAVPLFLLLALWIHLLRIARPKVMPARGLSAATFGALVALSLVHPAVSQGQADLGVEVVTVGLDWFYLAGYPVLDRLGPASGWALAVGATVVLGLLPWLPRARPLPVAEVDLGNCNGCSRCFADCPFGAVIMVPRTNGRPFPLNAVVDPALCTSCGICVGACPTATPFRSTEELVTGIDLPHRPLDALREELEAAARRGARPRIVVFGCDYGVDVRALDGVAALSLPCIGALPPSFIDYALTRLGLDAVVVTGCGEGACYQRFGVAWTQERIAGTRDPYLRERVPRDRLIQVWAAPHEAPRLERAIAELRRRLAATVGDGDAGAS
ncbi:MAG: cytochrome b N-terminal domain-containing protein [Alphaproteobacteria bacterium]